MIKHFAGSTFTQRALIYAYDVINGHRLAGKYERKACQRFIDDLTGANNHPFTYDVDKAERACRFIEKLPHIKGRWAAQRKTIELAGWQAFVIVNTFGWIDGAGFRRFRIIYLKIARKNGKSTIAAGIGLYMLAMDGEFGAEVYSGATNLKQAFEVFEPAKKMAEKTPEFIEHFGIEVNTKNINIASTNSKFEPLIGNPGDGANPSCAIVDEYHEHDSNNLVETMHTGMGARDQPLMAIITTAGDNIGGPCHDEETDAKKILDKVFQDDRYFTLIFEADENDDWTSPATLEKANPNIDVSVNREFLEGQLKTAIRSPLKQNAYKRKHLNLWVGAYTAWLNMDVFGKCAIDLDLDRMKTLDCVASIDLASRIDLVATPLVFHEEIDGKTYYYVLTRVFLPEETILKEENTQYQKWHNAGELIATDGNEIDFNEIEKSVVADMTEFGTNEVVYDPWRAAQLAQRLQKKGADIVEFRNTVPNMSPAMYELEAAIEGNRFFYDGNQVYKWAASNVVAKVDAKENIYPRKNKPKLKIDPIVATIMAVGRIMAEKEHRQDIDDFINDPIAG